MKMPTAENLATIKVVSRLPDTLTLVGIPYEMRPEQSPHNILPRFRDDWVYLGEPGWFGEMASDQMKLAIEFIATLKKNDLLPGNPYEWVVL